jgi:carboxylate-amine ligase
MLHRMSRYIPHFIALSASSPFVQGQDTQFDSARLNSVFAFPMSGRAPFTLQLGRVRDYFAKHHPHRRRRSMKDFYWDIRPKPEYGTIEIRVFDTPLTVERAAALSGFVQSLAAWFLHDQPFVPQRGRLHGLHLQPLPGLPLRAGGGVRRPGHRPAHAAARPHAADAGAGRAARAGAGRGGRSTALRDARPRSARNDARWLRETQFARTAAGGDGAAGGVARDRRTQGRKAPARVRLPLRSLHEPNRRLSPRNGDL